ncbi:hypothetical protein NSP_23630 [Nodularia spumigena CCY9414]|nr:hypothetical protein NSP_23630 [Nodularia spumigena CCY9414]
MLTQRNPLFDLTAIVSNYVLTYQNAATQLTKSLRMGKREMELSACVLFT